MADEPDTSAGSREVWQIHWANDAVLSSDNQFTNGVALRKHSKVFPSLAETQGTLAFGKGLASFFLPDSDSLHYRESWSFGHNMQTPENKERADLIIDDVPYIGMVGWANTFSAFNDKSYTGFEWLIGWVGDSTQAEGLQKAVHQVTGSVDPRGWANQLDEEPLLNLYFARK